MRLTKCKNNIRKMWYLRPCGPTNDEDKHSLAHPFEITRGMPQYRITTRNISIQLKSIDLQQKKKKKLD